MTGVPKPLKASIKASTQALTRQCARLQPRLPVSDEQWAKLALLGTLVQRDMTAR